MAAVWGAVELEHQLEIKPPQQTAPPREKNKKESNPDWEAVQLYVFHPHANQAVAATLQCTLDVTHTPSPRASPAECCSALFSFSFFHPAKQTVVSSHGLLFSDRLPRASQLSQKLGFQLSCALLEKKGRRAHSACSSIFVCLCVRARSPAHVEVNTGNLGLKECSVFCSRPSLFHRPATTDVHLDDCAAEVQEGETRCSAAT